MKDPEDSPDLEGTLIGDVIQAMIGRPIKWRQTPADGVLPYVPLHPDTWQMLIDCLPYDEESEEFEEVAFEIGNLFAGLSDLERKFDGKGQPKASDKRKELKTLGRAAERFLGALESVSEAAQGDLSHAGFSRQDQLLLMIAKAPTPLTGGEFGPALDRILKSRAERLNREWVSFSLGTELLPLKRLVEQLVVVCAEVEQRLAGKGGGASTRGRDVVLFRLSVIFDKHAISSDDEAEQRKERHQFIRDCLKTVDVEMELDAIRRALARVEAESRRT